MTVYRGVPLEDLPQGHYRVGLIDPPWKYLTYSAKGLGKSPDNHYNTMTVAEIKALPVRDLFAKNAAIFVWVIDSHVEIAMDILKHWSFKYRTVGFYWAKTTADGKGFPMGTGKWTRANPEHALEATLECAQCADTGFQYGDPDLGPCWAGCDDQEAERCMLYARGAANRKSGGVPRLIVSPRREHSRKPDEIYGRIEALLDGPYLEMFSRNDRPGWDCWGDEAGAFAIQQRLAALKPRKLSPEAEALI